MPWRCASAAPRMVISTPSLRIVPAIGPVDAGQDLDQRALAGAVLAGQRMNLAGLQAEIDVAQDLDRSEALA